MNASTPTHRKVLGFSLLAVLLFCLPFFKMEYATDTYTMIQVGYRAFGDSMFQNGRLVTGAALYLFDLFQPDIACFYYVSFALAILFAWLAVTAMTNLLLKRFPFKIAFPMAFLTVLNPLSVEYFLFIEKGYFMLAICMSVLALVFFTEALEGRYRRLPLSYLCLTVSAFTYQPLPGLFAVLAVPFALLHAKSFGRLVKSLLLAISIYGFGAFLNFLFIKLVGGSARAGDGIYFSNLWHSYLLAGPTVTPLSYLLFFTVLLLACIGSVKKKGYKAFSKQTFALFGACAVTFAAALTVTFIPFLFTDPSAVWFPCRIIYPIGTLIGTLPLLFYATERKPEKPRWFSVFFRKPKPAPRQGSRALTVLLLCSYIFFQVVMVGRLCNNMADHALCREIGGYIDEYESATGNKITSVSIYYDTKLSKYNPGVLFLGDSNVRAFSKEWSDVAHMNVVLGRSFEKAPCSETVYAQFFADQSWDSFHRDQLVFEGNTLHLCVY